MLDLYAATRNETLRVDLKTEISAFAVENDFVTRFTSLVVVAAQTRKRRSKEKQRQIRELFEQYAQNELIMRPDQEWFFSNRQGFLRILTLSQALVVRFHRTKLKVCRACSRAS